MSVANKSRWRSELRLSRLKVSDDSAASATFTLSAVDGDLAVDFNGAQEDGGEWSADAYFSIPEVRALVEFLQAGLRLFSELGTGKEANEAGL